MLNTLTLDNAAIDYAVAKLADFKVLNKDRDSDAKSLGLQLHCESLGLGEEETTYLFNELAPEWKKVTPFVFIGVMLGLRMAEHALEASAEK